MRRELLRFVFDTIYVVLFFCIMSAAAFGVGRVVHMCEAFGLDPIVVAVFRVLEVLLAVLDAVGVMAAAVVLIWRFVREVIIAERGGEHGDH